MGSSAEIVFRPKRLKHIGLVFLALTFAACGVALIRHGEQLGWWFAVFFGLGVPVSAVQLIPGASYLRLTESGFTVCSLYRATTYQWSDVVGFGTASVRGNALVVYDFSDTYQAQPRSRRAAKAFMGVEAAIPDTYGHSAEDLARIFNEWKSGMRRLDA